MWKLIIILLTFICLYIWAYYENQDYCNRIKPWCDKKEYVYDITEKKCKSCAGEELIDYIVIPIYIP